MAPIRNSPYVAPTPAPRPPPTAARPGPANEVARTDELNRRELERVRAARTPAAQPAPAARIPGSQRGGPDTEVGRAVREMYERVQRMPGANVTIRGDTPASLFGRAILDNPNITNEQILAMSRLRLEDIATPEATRQDVLRQIPNARDLPVHQFTVAMVAGATGLDPRAVSQACPDLGMTGAPDTPVFFASGSPSLQRSTALHDFTDYMRGAGIDGVNRAVWGFDNRVLSAIVSAVGGGRY